jgi:hypothetical protein
MKVFISLEKRPYGLVALGHGVLVALINGDQVTITQGGSFFGRSSR